jgi:hypothetical protein
MNHDDDQQLSRLLQTLAPPAHDPLFRIRLLERRERQQFVRRVTLLVAMGVAAAGVYAISATVGGTDGTVRRVGLFLALALGAAMYVPALFQAMRSMGGK